jgi:nucleotide-binding universal stress UspA family protein
MMLAKRESAELVVLHVIEATPGNRYYPRTQSLPNLAAIARNQIVHDLGDCAEKVQVRIEDGDPAEVIERVAREQGSTLIVVGVARIERLGRFSLGTTVERLVRGTELPLLIVTDRPRGPYERVCVAVDFSPVSRQTLELTTTRFREVARGRRYLGADARPRDSTHRARRSGAHHPRCRGKWRFRSRRDRHQRARQDLRVLPGQRREADLGGSAVRCVVRA